MNTTIAAPATAPGVSALAVIRVSGPESLPIVSRLWKGKNLAEQASHTAHFGRLYEGDDLLDEVVLTLFRNPRSFTGEDLVELSCHGSPFVVRRILEALLRAGALMAQPGEFTRRAFLNGKLDLAQAEAVGDLIHADSPASHQAAIRQLRGGVSQQIRALREELIHFAALVELELDFSEEDVEFANRDQLRGLIHRLMQTLGNLSASFAQGNALKNGVPTVIAGRPNAGKSTLLNSLIGEEKAIVSDIPGTTRDFIEDTLLIEGLVFRFIDTAGLRETTDQVEAIGVSRTREKMKQASLVIYLFDAAETRPEALTLELETLDLASDQVLVLVGNKADRLSEAQRDAWMRYPGSLLLVSALQGEGLEGLKQTLWRQMNLNQAGSDQVVITSLRHYQALVKTQEALQAVLQGMDRQITSDFLAMDIRRALFYLGEITGEITTDDLLATIFSKFCIGK